VALPAALAAALAARPLAEPVRVELGGGPTGTMFTGAAARTHRVNVDRENAPERKLPFYYQELDAHARVRLPLVPVSDTVALTVRASAPDGAVLDASLTGGAPERVYLRPGPWRRDRFALAVPARRPLEVHLAHDRLPGHGRGRSTLFVDAIEVADPGGLRPARAALAVVAALPLALGALMFASGAGVPLAAAASVAAAAVAVAGFRHAPVPFLAAAPRLLPAALGLAALTAWLLRRAALTGRTRAALVLLTAAGVLWHGSVAFFPNHNPPDRDIHVVRALDAGSVPFTYQDWLRYGSHLPTASQYAEKATLLFGEQALIPYSPLPALFYYALHRLGLDLDWAITVANTLAAMAVLPLMWLVARHLWNVWAAWTAALLYLLDLAVWHHVGRVHAPAALAGALGTAALLGLASAAPALEQRRNVLLAAGALAMAALGYSSLAVLFFLFGLVLLALLALDARALTPAARRGLAAAVVLSGLIAGLLYYFHYVPGVVRGAGAVEAEPDLFAARTYFIFRNEAKQSLRVWRLGFWLWTLAGLIAAPLAIARARATARPVLIAWLGAWALLMLLKDPLFLPRLLRWAKEDQFLSPLLCLVVAGAVAALPRPWMRAAAAALATAAAGTIHWGDFLLHANTLWL
jgi:hypothetical protein